MIKITILIKWSLTEADVYIRAYKAVKLMFNINTGNLDFSGYQLLIVLVIIELATSMKFIGLLLINLKFERFLVIFILNWENHSIKLKWKNHLQKNKIIRGKNLVNSYTNNIATYNFILARDTELNAGPGLHPKPKSSKCNACDKAVGTNRKRVKFDVCHNLTHVPCLNISKHQQKNYTVKTVPLMACNECLLPTLPFFKTRDLNTSFNTKTHDHPLAITLTSKS